MRAISLAGASLDEGGFGNATLNNRLVMSGEGGYVADLNSRFAASVPTVVTFPFDSTALTPEARAILDRQANFIRQFPELRFSVYGHTDLVGSAAYNERLGRARAQAVVSYLGSRGVSRRRLRALVSYGEARPAVAVSGPEQRNRRAVTEVSGFVRSHPMVLNGKYAEIVFREYVESATQRESELAVEGL
jgi:peptidoglycan-associated lipoprotein